MDELDGIESTLTEDRVLLEAECDVIVKADDLQDIKKEELNIPLENDQPKDATGPLQEQNAANMMLQPNIPLNLPSFFLKSSDSITQDTNGLSELKGVSDAALRMPPKEKKKQLDGYAEKPKREPRRNNCVHLDDFLWELLQKTEYASYIQWTSREKSEFKIIKPDKVASLWGTRKNRKMMTKDKLTRGIRYYYKTGKVQKVQHRQLHFRFTVTKM